MKLESGVFSVHSRAERETFHPVVGPVAEAEALYVRQLRLLERLLEESGSDFVIWDVGLGAAANALTVLRSTEKINRPIRLISFDRTLAPLEFALEHAEALNYFQDYEDQVAKLLTGKAVTFSQRERTVSWEVVVGDFPDFLKQPSATRMPAPHAILYDAFSPAKNPEMWSLPVFRNLFGLLDPSRHCALATYSRSTLLRVTLLLAGFHVGAGHATGEKEETTIAANTPALITDPLDTVWLQRAQRSTSAEPLHDSTYSQAPLQPETLQLLRSHPQFSPQPEVSK